MSAGRIRVLIADDHRLFREALRAVLAREFEVVGESASGEEALELAARLRPEVVLMDLRMAGIGGLNAAHRLAKLKPAPKVVVLSGYDDEQYVIEAMVEAGAAGYVLKDDSATDLLSAIRAVATGGRYLSSAVAPALIARLRNPEHAADTGLRLTRREREVLKLIGEGLTAKEIATRLRIAPKTAQVHRDNLKRKLNAKSTAAIVRYAIERKLIRVD
jgi:two-component system NarL family response regulator